jgi:hypothetical protein
MKTQLNEIKRMQQLAGLITENQSLINEELSKEEKIVILNKIAQTMEDFRNISQNIIPSSSENYGDGKLDYFHSLMLQIKNYAIEFINKINKQTELNENISNDVEKYLKYHFEVYLEGGDTFEEKPGKTHTFTMESDEFGNPEYYDDADIFKKAIEQLKNSPFILDYSEEGYGNITFKSDGINIIISFIVPPNVE